MTGQQGAGTLADLLILAPTPITESGKSRGANIVSSVPWGMCSSFQLNHISPKCWAGSLTPSRLNVL